MVGPSSLGGQIHHDGCRLTVSLYLHLYYAGFLGLLEKRFQFTHVVNGLSVEIGNDISPLKSRL